MNARTQHQVVIVGGGTAGITLAARLLRKGYSDVAVIEPSDKHYYQPLWTLVGGGQADASSTERAEASVMPKDVTWIRKSASAFDPENNTVTCSDGSIYGYDVLVVAPGLQLDWDATEGLVRDTRPRRGLVELPVRSGSAHLGLHPWNALGHSGLHHADRAGEVCGRAARRSPIWRPITGAVRVSSRTSTSTWWRPARGFSESRRSRTAWTR